MGTLQKTNAIRRNIMRRLTKNISGDKSIAPIVDLEKEQVKNILVIRPNHRLGNLLLVTPLLQEVETIFPDSKIDIFVKGSLAPIVLKEYKNIDRIIALPKEHFRKLPSYLYSWCKLRKRKYDLVLNVEPNSSSGRLSTKWSRGRYKAFGDERVVRDHMDKEHMHIAKLPVSNFRDLLKSSQDSEGCPVPTLDLKLAPSEHDLGRETLKKLVGDQKKTIALFTYATGKKCYSQSWWIAFYNELKQHFPQYAIIEVLPKEGGSQINFQAPAYYSQNIREICGLLANTALFIGADSGMMHLAVASQTPVVGLFSVTDVNKYTPYGHKNSAINTEETTIAENIAFLKEYLHE